MSSLRKSERGRRPLLVILRSEATKNLLRSIRQIVTRADSLRSLSRADQATQSNRGRSLAALGMTERERGARDDKRTLFTGLQPGALEARAEAGRRDGLPAAVRGDEKQCFVGETLAAQPLGEIEPFLRPQHEERGREDVRREPGGGNDRRRSEIRRRASRARVEQMADPPPGHDDAALRVARGRDR